VLDRPCLVAVAMGGKHWLRCSTSRSGTTRARLAGSRLCLNLKRERYAGFYIKSIPDEEGGVGVLQNRGGGGGGIKTRFSEVTRIGSV
jgi:hypothetical protein